MTYKQISVRQLELLLEFMEKHQSLALGRVRGKEFGALSNRLWAQCAELLNSDSDGAHKSANDWKKYYNQYKSRAKAKQRVSGTAENVILTSLEERLIAIVGGGRSSLPARHNHLDASKFNQDGAIKEEGGSDSSGSVTYESDLSHSMQYEPGQSNSVQNEWGPFTGTENEPGSSVKSVSPSAKSGPPNTNPGPYSTEPGSPNKTCLVNVEVMLEPNSEMLDDVAPTLSTNNTENGGTDTNNKSPLRKNTTRVYKRRHRKHSSSPEVTSKFEEAGQRLAAMEQSRIEVDREMVKATHRQAAALEQIAVVGNRFITLCENMWDIFSHRMMSD